MFVFADDTKFFMKIVSELDIQKFQEDLSSVSIWGNNHNSAYQTPNRLSTNLSSSQLIKVKLNEIKVISVNCCSMRSLSRQASLCGLIHEHKPDIIVGCKSHLDDSYTSSETL